MARLPVIDDASRFITGVDVFFNDTFVNLMSVMKSAISKFGKPKIFNFDYTDILTIPNVLGNPLNLDGLPKNIGIVFSL